ncbi:MAG: amino acid ABC transporter substrate-binding protein [Silicimonas sp.]|nr:amino acid ABC transporter substrate-binding protein [Silicimonas sp.]
MKLLMTSALFLATTAGAFAQCAEGLTMDEGTLTIATGNPAYFPWVIDDAPETKQGFEAAVAYAVAAKMGFADDQVTWVRSSFDQAIQPGAKDFDLNLQQFSITEERDEIVDFSAPYYSAAMAVVTREPVVNDGAEATLASLKGLAWGAHASTTAVPMLAEVVQPDADPLLYGDNADVVEAMKANQIDAALMDLPTALYTAAVLMDDGVVLGQFPPERSENPDQFGMILEEGNPLKACVDEAIGALKADGTLAAIENQWLSATTGVPVIK